MDSNHLTAEQARRLRLQVAAKLRWLNKLQERLKRLGFPPEDSIYRATTKARDAMQDLHVAAHYAGCRHGVGRKGSE